MKELKLNITQQGAVLVNEAVILEKSSKLVYAAIDLKTKRVEMMVNYDDENHTPIIELTPTNDSKHLNPDSDDTTVISFPTLKGFSIKLGDCSRYTITLLFVKND